MGCTRFARSALGWHISSVLLYSIAYGAMDILAHIYLRHRLCSTPCVSLRRLRVAKFHVCNSVCSARVLGSGTSWALVHAQVACTSRLWTMPYGETLIWQLTAMPLRTVSYSYFEFLTTSTRLGPLIGRRHLCAVTVGLLPKMVR